jgi:hypothetical protein
VLRPALLCGPHFLSILNYRAANCPRIAAPCCSSVECLAALFYISAQPKPSIFGWLFITHLLLVINGELGQFALYRTTSILCGCLAFAFPAVPHFNNRYLRATCSTSRTSTATSTAPSTLFLFQIRERFWGSWFLARVQSRLFCRCSTNLPCPGVPVLVGASSASRVLMYTL